MKTIITLALLLMVALGCSENQEQPTEPTASIQLSLDGFWMLSSSHVEGEKTLEQDGCPFLDSPSEVHPNALGTHLLVTADSISLFRYPFEYYGTYAYTIVGDSFFIKTDYTSTTKFSIQKNDEHTLLLSFDEALNSTCLLSAKATYESLVPEMAVINKLIQDSISYDELIGKWWYLGKEIGFEDGSIEPILLDFPKGMPDSVFVSEEMINRDGQPPFVELELDNRIVKMLFKKPSEYSFRLAPRAKDDELLFSRFIDYEDGNIDTVYDEVIYRKNPY